MNRVVLSNISKTFSETSVIPTLSLSIGENEFLSLLGPSGCGKTTIIRMIAGLENPTQGSIQIGEDCVFDSEKGISIPPEKRGLGMVFQSYALWPHMTVLENIAFPLKCQKVSPSQIKERCEKILAQVQLGGLENRKPNQLSGGQQQRVALARALVYQPKVLLLDEPLSNLDANLREEMCEQIGQIKKQSPISMIYVTHDQNEAVRLSDRIAILNKGKIEQIGTPSELREKPANEFVRNFLKI